MIWKTITNFFITTFYHFVDVLKILFTNTNKDISLDKIRKVKNNNR